MTFLSLSDTSWFHLALWNTGPLKGVFCANSGTFGSLKPPTAVTRKLHVFVFSSLVSRSLILSFQSAVEGSKRASVTAVLKEMLLMQYFCRTPRMYRMISGCSGHELENWADGAKLKE